jgi:UDP-N-acetyl-D-glucosamine dehydrogenase
VLGVAYKPNVGDPRESPGLTLIDLLQDRGAEVDYNDPYVPALPPTRKHKLKKDSVALTAKSLGSYDAVLIVTAHSKYDYDFIVENARIVLDTRNATHAVKKNREKIFKA